MTIKNRMPNPQGKGDVSLLNHWQQFRPQAVAAKPAAQLLAELFSSLLVLSADFSFKPVQGIRYFLYLKNGRWKLSLIEPMRWDHHKSGYYLGCCVLQPDMTWTLQVHILDNSDPVLMHALAQFYKALLLHLDSEQPLLEKLPFYVDNLPYYQRLAATGLASSISQSLAGGNSLHNSSAAWLDSLGSASRHGLHGLLLASL